MVELFIEKQKPEVTSYRRLPSPLGEILIAGSDDRISLLSFQQSSDPAELMDGWNETPSGFADAAQQIAAYFRKELVRFDLEIQVSGTPFQTSVWKALLEIPYGETVSYAEIAERIGRKRAVRAVGAANSVNPVPLFLPCHRVIGANGHLTGYRGGIEIKRQLLDLERAGR